MGQELSPPNSCIVLRLLNLKRFHRDYLRISYDFIDRDYIGSLWEFRGAMTKTNEKHCIIHGLEWGMEKNLRTTT